MDIQRRDFMGSALVLAASGAADSAQAQSADISSGTAPPTGKRSVVYKGKEVLMNLEAWADPRHTAILVVDVQNDFCSPGGNVSKTADVAPLQTMLGHLARLLDGARRAGVRIVYVQQTAYPDAASESPAYMAFRMRPYGESYPQSCWDGTWGHQICDQIKPKAGEVVVRKQRQPPWIGTNLDQMLRSNGIKTIVATGTQTSACVDWTARLGVQMDYYVVVAEDCVSQTNKAAHDASIETVRRYLPAGAVTDANGLLKLWGVA